MKKYAFLGAIVIMLAFHSCAKEKGIPKVVSTCDSTVSFSTTIAPLLNAQCNSCHSGSTPSGGVDFTTYANTAPHAASMKNRVVTIQDMPQSGSGYTLTDAERKEFGCWIEQGALDN